MKLRRILACVIVFCLAGAAAGATTADRSPFWQGHWWNSQQPGSGFDIFSTAGQAMAVWYTYDESGRPVWYTTQGSVDSLGSAWPLMQHRWADGRSAGFAVVGTMRLN